MTITLKTLEKQKNGQKGINKGCSEYMILCAKNHFWKSKMHDNFGTEPLLPYYFGNMQPWKAHSKKTWKELNSKIKKENDSFLKRWEWNYQNRTLCKTEMAGDDRDDSSAQVWHHGIWRGQG